jgi:predicted pyridoxine 5'-phosphate oxidase superfamily flavin-nucleotide-binding protein
VTSVSADVIEIAVDECFVHCAKALIRSDFWAAQPAAAPDDAAEFVNASRFLALATADESGRIDISPKGDPAGLLIRTDGRSATMAERPGNRLAFGYRNIIAHPAVSAVALIPGSTSVARLRGRAHLSTGETVRSAFEVEGKIPILATVIEDLKIERSESAALERAEVRTAAQVAPTIDPSATLVGHVKLNKTLGLQATELRTATNRSIVAKGLEQAYKHTLY